MHPLFHVPELVDLICDVLRLDSLQPCHEPHVARKTLADLSRTAKLFEVPALSALWHTQHTLSNLIKVLPSRLWVEEEFNEAPGSMYSQYKLVVTRSPARGEAIRFIHYCSFIKELGIGYNPHVFIDMKSIFIHLSPYISFPYLHSLSLTSDALRYIRRLLNPNIQMLDIHGQWDRPETRAALASIKSMCRTLGDLRIHIAMQPPALPDVDPDAQDFASFIVGLPLRHLRTKGRIADGGLQYLSSLSHLSTLEFTESAPGQGFPSGSFSALRELKVICTSHAFAMSLFGAMNRCPLEVLHCHSTSACNTPQLHALLTELARGVDPRTLTRVAFSCNHFDDEDDDDAAPRADNIITLPIVAPLRAFPGLIHVCITSQDGCNFTDEELLTIGSWWRHAVCITLPGCNHARAPPRATLRGVMALARQAPDLQELDVVFDMRDADGALRDVRAMLLRGTPHEALVMLGSMVPHKGTTLSAPVGAGPAPYADPIAHALRLAFPRLEAVCVDDGVVGWATEEDDNDWASLEHAYRARWQEVNAYLALTKAVTAT
ncbi:hypothetical protein BD626DRAFT_541150 [Schizophyllum amplum]|uniref:F-box domain-containing protein n=1 Tax=Schizophyllum amplum TaxID=97359 RepID=A0A550BVV9_9AGAR|nr:hypothetical protein BD626DRAFT_541150 [Auriculariopsis ampla]